MEERALPRLTVYSDAPLMALYDALHYRESHSRPLPRAFVVKYGSKIRSSVDLSIPCPVSLTLSFR